MSGVYRHARQRGASALVGAGGQQVGRGWSDFLEQNLDQCYVVQNCYCSLKYKEDIYKFATTNIQF